MKRGRERKWMLDRAAWHELKMTVDGADFKAWIDGELALEYTLGSEPGPGPEQRAAKPRSVSREQPGAAAAGDRQGRSVVEDRQHELLQGLRRRQHVIGTGQVGAGARWPTAEFGDTQP